MKHAEEYFLLIQSGILLLKRFPARPYNSGFPLLSDIAFVYEHALLVKQEGLWS